MGRKNISSTPSSGKTGYIAYYRVSSARQGQSGLGLDAQREAVARLAKAGPILAEYTEVESAKSHRNRPQLLAAMAEAKKRDATLLIAKLDRLARNVHFISGLMESGVDFVAADMPEAMPLTLHIFAAMAEHERRMISQRTKAGMDAAKREIEVNGFRISRRSGRPYAKHGNPNWKPALEAANNSKRKPEQVADEISEIIRKFRAEGFSFRQIAARLNDRGIQTPSKSQWHPSSVRAAVLKPCSATESVPTAHFGVTSK
jgi:DNA invertase Pin-like site-specific DNA recombinase